MKLLTDRDILEVGATTRIDDIAQSDTRLLPDGTIHTRNIDASVDATGIAGYVDAAIYPIPRVVVRGGTRLDSIAYSVTDHLGNQGIEQTLVYASNSQKSATLPPPSAHALVAPPASVFLTLKVRLGGRSERSEKEEAP